MNKDSKILFATVVVCTIALAVFQYVMTMKAVSVNLRAAQEINKKCKGHRLHRRLRLLQRQPVPHQRGR
jgi:hypothetical protein